MPGALFLSLLILTQTPDSSYDRYALRLVYGPGSTGVVRGIEAEPVGGGIFVPSVDLLATAPDSVRREYNASRVSFKRYTFLGGLSIAGVLGTMVYYGGHLRRDWHAPMGIGLPVATVVVWWAASASATNGEDRLRRAIWLYNEHFQRAAGPGGPDCTYDRCALRVRPGVWSTQIVRGADGVPIGGFDSRLDLLAAANDSARRHYDAFRAAYGRAHVARRIGLGAYLTAGALFAATQNKVAHGFAVGFLVVGFAAAHGSVYATANAASQLDHAIWFYNRALPE